jgi:hypothetical protein
VRPSGSASSAARRPTSPSRRRSILPATSGSWARPNGALFGPLAGGYDAFALRFDPEGGRAGAWQDGTAGFDAYLGVAIDPDGYVLLAGTTDAAWHGPHAGLTDAVAAKLDPAGGLVWAHQIGTPGLDEAYGIAVDGAGRSYLAGGTTGVIDGTHAGSYDVFLIGLRP